ncbi:cysteine-rich CWC family protein [Chitinophaga sp. sic0106]|uniref:cysteine-rich CWC family protein n=1 Tax=Chitinophaga sp. sic0106 TaxID=2854785 RepID=UPI001C45AB67|nr:cysteine-rich CWC family protein [Chitinophaga sp. sic0106]MBV7532747.1 cysteine-rich CWC family protein [Chitinophaga sp. sic0106]
MSGAEKNSSICPRCGKPLVCEPENIHQCWCTQVRLDGDDRQYIGERYTDCLCNQCLEALKTERRQALTGE